MTTYGLDVEFPLLWASAGNADDRERLGLTVGQGDEESARAMRELWDARRNQSSLDTCASCGAWCECEVSISLVGQDARALYDHTGTMPHAPGSWSNNVRAALSEALAPGATE